MNNSDNFNKLNNQRGI